MDLPRHSTDRSSRPQDLGPEAHLPTAPAALGAATGATRAGRR